MIIIIPYFRIHPCVLFKKKVSGGTSTSRRKKQSARAITRRPLKLCACVQYIEEVEVRTPSL